MTEVAKAVAEGLAERKSEKQESKEGATESAAKAPAAAPESPKEEVVAEAAPAPEKVEEKTEVVAEEAPAPEKVEEKAEAAAEVTADDLTKVEGIGPKAAEALVEAGIKTYADLSGQDPEKIKEILAAKSSRLTHLEPGTWPKQAAMAAAGQWDELNAWQDEAKGGIEKA